MRRRAFLSIPAGIIAGSILAPREDGRAADTLHLLRGNDLERLRLDFNASRSKVRMLVLVSPT